MTPATEPYGGTTLVRVCHGDALTYMGLEGREREKSPASKEGDLKHLACMRMPLVAIARREPGPGIPLSIPFPDALGCWSLGALALEDTQFHAPRSLT